MLGCPGYFVRNENALSFHRRQYLVLPEMFNFLECKIANYSLVEAGMLRSQSGHKILFILVCTIRLGI